MTKVMQEEHLIVYVNDVDKDAQYEHLKLNCTKWVEGDQWFNQLTCRDSYGQYNYTFVKLEPFDDFIMRICGCEFYCVSFLEGSYPSDVIMFSLGRCRLGVWEADEI